MAIELYESDDVVEIDSIENIASVLIKTTKIKTYLSILKIYLEEAIPFNVIGPSGSGTRYYVYLFCLVLRLFLSLVYLHMFSIVIVIHEPHSGKKSVLNSI